MPLLEPVQRAFVHQLAPAAEEFMMAMLRLSRTLAIAIFG